MVSYVFSIIQKQIFWEKVHKILESKYKSDFELVFSCQKSNTELDELLNLQKSKKNVKVIVFDEEKTENELLSEAIKQSTGTQIVLCRDYFEFTTVMSDVLVSMGQVGVEIAMFQKQKKTNKFVNFFKKLYHKLVKMVFGFSLYEGDIGLMYFGNIATSTMRALNNPILLTKVNRWTGFEPSYVQTEELAKPVLKKSNKNKTIWLLSLSIFLVLAFTALFVVTTVFAWIDFLQGFFIIVAILLCLLWTDYLSLKLMVISRVGDLK